MADHREGLDRIPAHMHEGIIAYIETGRPIGGFLNALLSNDLKETFARADDQNGRCIREWVQYLYAYAPRGCWGSQERVDAWQAQGGLKGLEQ